MMGVRAFDFLCLFPLGVPIPLSDDFLPAADFMRASYSSSDVSLQGANSIEKVGLEFWFEKWLEIPFLSYDSSKLPIFELVLTG